MTLRGKPYRKLFFCLLLAGSLAFSSCNGLDDNSMYASKEETAYFMLAESNGHSIARLQDDQLTLNWNQQLGLNTAEVGDVQLMDGEMWIANPVSNQLVQPDPDSEILIDTWSLGDFSPHYFAPGRTYFLCADTSRSEIAFVHKKKKTIFRQTLDEMPGQPVWNGGKFYLLQGCCTVGIFNEAAVTQYASFELARAVHYETFDLSKNLVLLCSDSSGNYFNLIDANGDVLTTSDFKVGYKKIEYSPWFNQVYGTEFIGTVRHLNPAVEAIEETSAGKNTFTITDSASFFSTDFLTGTLYYTWQDTLHGYDLTKKINFLKLPMPANPEKAFFLLRNGP
ncbi:MAG: hypothetical protein H6581_19350 [Bacteroidia bacterium]|nr:hypothetical protein [Bacteroidia bacterium]